MDRKHTSDKVNKPFKTGRRRLIKLSAIAVLFAALIITQTSCSGTQAQPVTDDGYFLDTICSVSIYRMTDADGKVKEAAKMEDEAKAAIDESFDLCKALEDKLSRTRTNSDISKLNSAKGEWVEVSDETADLLIRGLEYSIHSDGDFDITVGGVTKLWDFHAAEGEAKLPDEEALAEAVKHVGFSNLEIKGNKVRLKDPETEVDLGGIAKGYIGDMMTDLLEEKGVVSATINLGGNVICIGSKTDEDDFVIGVEAPFSDRTEIIGKIPVRDKTLVTSGIYERKIEVDGKLYHHILDTKTGMPVDSELTAVTLVADKGLSADLDAASTICLIKGYDGALEYLEEYMPDGVEGVFVFKNGDIKTTANSHFEEE